MRSATSPPTTPRRGGRRRPRNSILGVLGAVLGGVLGNNAFGNLIARGSQQWRNATAIAQIAHAGSWRSPVEGALYFHAAFVTPAWRLARVGRIENHVFYR